MFPTASTDFIEALYLAVFLTFATILTAIATLSALFAIFSIACAGMDCLVVSLRTVHRKITSALQAIATSAKSQTSSTINRLSGSASNYKENQI